MNTQASKYSVLVIGGGSTGAAVAHDLALRGFKTTLVERGEIASGTTGRNHCLLHSGARYCVKDKESAIECIEENMILRKIMPDSMELNGGLFVAVNDSDMAYMPLFIEGCEETGIPYKQYTGEEARRLEPYLSEKTLAAVWVPDGVFEPMRMCMAFLATAKKNGALVLPYTEVKGLHMEGNRVTGARVWDRIQKREYDLYADLVVNAAGPWAENIARMAGVDVPVVPTPGVMTSMTGRLCQRVINRMNVSSDGDIIVPQRQTSIIGTSSWTVDDADYIEIPEDHVQLMYQRGSEMIPQVGKVKPRGIFVVARPLIGRKGQDEREIARTFEAFDHAVSDNVEGFVTISGGKTTTARAMAETTVNVIADKLDVEAPCQTRDTVLLSYRDYYLI
ncbi:MAG: FAD-dependent oxidoreductase [Aggregatilineales bacterium]|nr:FAD-dependent oxidoreductase [Aggregatilineales bacterium]HPV06193.1 FAD-dependent oxidoreductase [Aggregatilineales bacterium]